MASPSPSNHFALFDLPEGFELDKDELASRYRRLAAALHPDRFASGSERDRAQALAKTALLNDAFDTLRHATRRAEYLLSLNGLELADESRTLKDTAFLMQQMEWREALMDVEDADGIDTMRKTILAARAELHQEFAAQYGQQDFDTAADTVRKLKFVDKMLIEIERLEESLLDY
ncbi:Fe-S protein assembly co-chaperone HscB [Gallaecimonas pentaromativorans]|uniref:Co-chaperone protein HscB n=1 Tax=Gallaecimonas pentaromativorans TaxID=584787 RepID=A0A3N1PP35_9GAMM|nr:Fe-S protein assembly co-chaperone HscB [Gallaecimonas pentaromativorans]MED5524660.1 Fe-S protein assembly co-chaperone HscB [Pseudomonadota bacterium]ROQ28650.1 co-chaperone protein HscB [Gallaecimonas pentaromativorans]